MQNHNDSETELVFSKRGRYKASKHQKYSFADEDLGGLTEASMKISLEKGKLRVSNLDPNNPLNNKIHSYTFINTK